jgi:hypothetical protein
MYNITSLTHIVSQVLENSVNLKSYNSEILIIGHLWTVALGPEVSLFAKKETLSMKYTDLRNMFKKVCNIVCTSTVAVSTDILSPPP